MIRRQKIKAGKLPLLIPFIIHHFKKGFNVNLSS
jgi:hypothetical protein